MAIAPSQTFAVLVGINDYQSAYNSLRGCINDVTAVRDFLVNKSGVPTHNISTLTSPVSSTSPPLNPVLSAKLPTKANLLELIDEVAEQAVAAGPGSLLLLHYSGHGMRKDTVFPEKKGKNSFDELLCTLGEEILDVEVAELLDTLDGKGLTVLVVLDCCHSGGADRITLPGGGLVRCPENQKDQPDWAMPALPPIDGELGEEFRNAVLGDSWFSLSRAHNMLAACQPSEKARERIFEGNSIGFMTHFLIKALGTLWNSETPVTYGVLMKHLLALCRSPGQTFIQQPVHLGEDNRVLFSKQTEAMAVGLQAGITEVNGNTITLNRGLAHGLDPHSSLSLFPPNTTRFGVVGAEALPTAVAQVTQAWNLMAKATVRPEDGGLSVVPSRGWFACLTQRGKPLIVELVQTSNQSRDAVARLEIDWKSLASRTAVPLVNLSFSPQTDPTIRLKVAHDGNGDSIKFIDSENKEMEHIPSLRLDDPTLVDKLAYLLPHLCLYRRLIELTPVLASTNSGYEFSIESAGNRDPSTPRLQHQITFHNKSLYPLYITIFNLTPAYGISQLIPVQAGSSCEVDPGKTIRGAISIEPPQLLAEEARQPGFHMCDLFKVIITTEQTSFSHYIQPDLKDWNPSDSTQLNDPNRDRNAFIVGPSPDEFWVETHEVETSYDGSGVASGTNIH